jgi:hypothetical protein
MSELLNEHHYFYSREAFRKAGGCRKSLRDLGTIACLITSEHKVIHDNIKPPVVPNHLLANQLLIVARGHQRGIQRLGAIIDVLPTIYAHDSFLSQRAYELHNNLWLQKQVLTITYK